MATLLQEKLTLLQIRPSFGLATGQRHGVRQTIVQAVQLSFQAISAVQNPRKGTLGAAATCGLLDSGGHRVQKKSIHQPNNLTIKSKDPKKSPCALHGKSLHSLPSPRQV